MTTTREMVSESQQYLRDFSGAVSKETTTASIVQWMTGLYPDWENVHTSGIQLGRPSPGRRRF
jgi:hypothetical protein